MVLGNLFEQFVQCTRLHLTMSRNGDSMPSIAFGYQVNVTASLPYSNVTEPLKRPGEMLPNHAARQSHATTSSRTK